MRTPDLLKHLIACSASFIMGQQAYAATFTVTRTADDGAAGSLRWAITEANATPGVDVIEFNIPVAGNTFEASGGNTWAVIALSSALPVITEAVLINGATQPDTNTGFAPGRTVGADNLVQPNINYPDVYITRNFARPADDAGFSGNMLTVNAADVTIRGLAISGGGNSNTTSQPVGTAHADISVQYSAAPRTINLSVTDCFISCDPRGMMPTGLRQTRGGGILVLGNNNTGTIRSNYVAHSGAYGIVFHASQDNITNTSPNIAPSTNWLIESNQVLNAGVNGLYPAGGLAGDGISMMTVRNSTVRTNYVENWEQFAIDMGHNADFNLVENNTATGFTKTHGAFPCGAIRSGFSSDNNTIRRNRVFNNTSTEFVAGIYSDENQSGFAGAVVKNNSATLIAENIIYDNVGSGITLGTAGGGTVTGFTISRNATYNNGGLGIDLGYVNTVAVTTNDNGDGDTGPNNLLNFPIISDATFNRFTRTMTVVGYAPAGSTIEFFVADGGANRFGGRATDYGEGQTFLASFVEGSAADQATGVGSYNSDGNRAVNNQNNFRFVLSMPTYSTFVGGVTATATLAGNTSEFGTIELVILSHTLHQFSGATEGGMNTIRWNATHNADFDHFEVERSSDGLKFTTLGVVRPADGYQVPHSYSFADANTPAGAAFYRLKMVSVHEGVTYSAVVRLTNEQAAAPLMAVPNPFAGQVAINFRTPAAAQLTLSIYDAAGTPIISQQVKAGKGNNSLTVPQLQRVPPGVYTVVLHGEGYHQQCRIVKQ